MAKVWAIKFYGSTKWHQVRTAYMTHQHWQCERCEEGAEICHHKIYLTPSNINDPTITLAWGNLEALCRLCHEDEHKVWRGSKGSEKHGRVVSVIKTNEDGSVAADNLTVDNLLDGLIL